MIGRSGRGSASLKDWGWDWCLPEHSDVGGDLWVDVRRPIVSTLWLFPTHRPFSIHSPELPEAYTLFTFPSTAQNLIILFWNVFCKKNYNLFLDTNWKKYDYRIPICALHLIFFFKTFLGEEKQCTKLGEQNNKNALHWLNEYWF